MVELYTAQKNIRLTQKQKDDIELKDLSDPSFSFSQLCRDAWENRDEMSSEDLYEMSREHRLKAKHYNGLAKVRKEKEDKDLEGFGSMIERAVSILKTKRSMGNMEHFDNILGYWAIMLKITPDKLMMEVNK